MQKIIAFVVICALVVFGMSGSVLNIERLPMFLDRQTLILQAGLLLAVMCVVYPIGKSILPFALMFFRPLASSEDAEQAIDVCTFAAKANIAVGFINCFMGFILMIQDLEDPSTIGPNLAISLLSILYALVFQIFILVLKHNAKLVLSGSAAKIDGALPCED